MIPTLAHFLAVSLILFAAGVTTMLTKRSAIAILIGVELVLNAAAINFVAFSRFATSTPDPLGVVASPVVHHGQIFGAFIIVLAAAEAAMALAIFMSFYHNYKAIDVEKGDELKG